MHETQARRTLAVVIRSGRFGYALFEPPTHLLDFGETRFHSRAEARIRIRVLLDRFLPSILVTDDGGRGKAHRRLRRSMLKMIRTQSASQSVPVGAVSTQQLRIFFRNHGKVNKYDFVEIAAVWFPLLRRKLPPKRVYPNPEPWMMARVDAVILGAAYLNLKELPGANQPDV